MLQLLLSSLSHLQSFEPRVRQIADFLFDFSDRLNPQDSANISTYRYISRSAQEQWLREDAPQLTARWPA